MNNVKKTCLAIAAVVAALAVVLYASGIRVDIWFGDKEYSAFVAHAGDPPSAYEQRDGVGYLTVPYHNPDGFLTLTVEDETLQNELAEANLSEIIGINFFVYVPGSILDEVGLGREKFDAIAYISCNRANAPESRIVLNEVFF